MPWPTEELRRRFGRPENEDLLRYLEEQSPHAHSDLGVLILDAAKKFPGAGAFGPNITACSYVFAHTRAGIAFALAVDMRSLALRLPDQPLETEPFTRIGPGWREFDPFDPRRAGQRNAELLSELLAAAFEHASTRQ